MFAVTPMSRVVPNQALIGLTLAGLIAAVWLTLHIYGVYFHRWTIWSILTVPPIAVFSRGRPGASEPCMASWATMNRPTDSQVWPSTPDFGSRL